MSGDIERRWTIEASGRGFVRRPLVLVLESGTMFWATAEDEGNGGGALQGLDVERKEIGLPLI